MMRYVRITVALLALACGFVLAVGFVVTLPDEDLPWTKLDLNDPVGAFTEMKLDALSRNPDACYALLEEAGMEFSPLPPVESGDFCGYDDGVEIEKSTTPYSAAVVARCPLAATLFLWERDVVQAAAQEIYGQKVSRIGHYGTYACRRVYGRPNGSISEHASANAIDVAEFRLEDGRTVSLRSDWTGEDEDAEFLREIRKGSCDLFQGVISPDYNKAHEDHFHLDMGPYDFCR